MANCACSFWSHDGRWLLTSAAWQELLLVDTPPPRLLHLLQLMLELDWVQAEGFSGCKLRHGESS